MNTYSIPHEHPHAGRIPDWYPLHTSEIAALLEAARDAWHQPDRRAGTETVVSIQVRLLQGIPGMTCPRMIEGPISDLMDILEDFFVRWIKAVGPHEPISAWLIRQFDLLLNGGTPCETDDPLVIAWLTPLPDEEGERRYRS